MIISVTDVPMAFPVDCKQLLDCFLPSWSHAHTRDPTLHHSTLALLLHSVEPYFQHRELFAWIYHTSIPQQHTSTQLTAEASNASVLEVRAEGSLPIDRAVDKMSFIPCAADSSIVYGTHAASIPIESVRICTRRQVSCSAGAILERGDLRVEGLVMPSCRHTTCASDAPQLWSQTVPHSPLRQISTLPSFLVAPSTNLRPPSTVQVSATTDKS